MKTETRKDTTALALSNLSSGLWRIQELMELLSYKLEVQQVLIETGRSRWMSRATAEIESVLTAMREAELMRAVDAGPVCEELDLPLDTPLSEIAAAAPSPWNHVLEEHRTSLSRITQELSKLSRSNTDMLEASYRAVQDALDRINHRPSDATYTASGTRVAARTHHLFDLTT